MNRQILKDECVCMKQDIQYDDGLDESDTFAIPTVASVRARVSAQSTPAVSSTVRRSLLKIKITCFILILVPISAEIICRYAIGLGNPPLYQADAAMEYLLQPSKTYYRFHKRFDVNQYSMRSDYFPPQKSSAEELRVLVIGDSVIYGGVRIDQDNIDTEILKRNLQSQLHVPVVVGNASAKSWGPPNELEYLKRFSTLDADVVILELSSHDYADSPTFVKVVGISADYPDKKPWSAVADMFQTYILPRYFHYGVTPPGIDKTMINNAQSEQDIVECRTAEREFFRFARAHHAKVALLQHLTLAELKGGYQIGYAANQQVAKDEHVPYVDDAEELRAELKSGESPFYSGDSLHPNKVGQKVLAHALQQAVDLALKNK
jgi:hypothetical protein